MSRITDFGEARKVDVKEGMTMTTGVGTPYYMAPEIISNNRHYSTAVDVYSYGIMAAEIINGKLEYKNAPEFESLYCL